MARTVLGQKPRTGSEGGPQLCPLDASHFCNSTNKSNARRTQHLYSPGNVWLTSPVGVSIHRGVIIMKRSLFLAVSVLALAAVSKPLFAAEAETPAPSERAAPTTERTERARPARERRAAPARTTSGQQQASQTSSYTGVQAGGFGGGNAGGGGFADPTCLGNQGSISPIMMPGGLNQGCTPAPFSQGLNQSGGIGGVSGQWTVPVTQWIVVGVVGDGSFGKTTSTQTQNNLYAPNPMIPLQVTQEQITNSFSQS